MADIFNTADIVVCISRDAINRQFDELARQAVIPNRLQVYRQSGADNQYTFAMAPAVQDIPAGAPAIVATIRPSIDIAASGTTALLRLDFLPGSSASFRFPDDGSGTLIALDMNGWSFGVAVNLNLTSYGQGKIALAPSVDQHLRQLSDSMFDIQHLFLDLDSIDHETADPALIKVSDSRPAVQAAFASFMHFYLADLKRKGNPFVLGSTVLASGNSALQIGNGQAADVPDVLLPASMTYSLFYDAPRPGRSCLCYAVATKGGHGTVSSPPNLMFNPIQSDGIDGVIAFSHAVFVEPLILRPMFEHIRDNVYGQIKNTLSISAQECCPDYPHVLPSRPWGSDQNNGAFGGGIEAMHMSIGELLNPGGALPVVSWAYTIAAVNYDDDRYHNQYTVTLLPADGNVTALRFDGGMQIFKQHTTSLGFFGNAQAWANVDVSWSAMVAIEVANNGTGVDIVSRTTPLQQQITPSDGHNVGASITDAVHAIADIAVDLATSPLSLVNLFSGFGDVNVGGIGMLGAAVNSLGTVARTAFVMPAGAVFQASSPQIDAMGNYQLNLTAR